MRLPSTSGSLAAVYNHVPPLMRGWLASVYGARSQRLRYGGSFARHLAMYRDHDTWSGEQFEEWQNARLQALLRHACEHVPYYRWLREQGEFPIENVRRIGDLPRLPLLEKETVRRNPTAFLASPPDSLHQYHTSGTTGTPVRLFRSTETVRAWYACFERRAREWSGVRRGDRFAALGGQIVAPFARRKPPFWVWNGPGRQLYMSVYHLSPGFLDAYLDEIARRRIVYLYGYASALDALAAHAVERGRDDVRLKVAISNAEPLFDHQRERLQMAFGCAARDTFVPSELAVGAFECEGSRMHLSMELGLAEILDSSGRPAAAGEAGELVCTGLLNFDQVFIRYRLGDRAALLSPTTPPCTCGRQAPALAAVEGRMDDLLLTPDGRRVGRLDPVFKGDMAIREAQIVQTALDRLEVRVVPAPGYSERDAVAIDARLRERMGPVLVSIRLVDQLERSAHGKLRAVVNRIETLPQKPPPERALTGSPREP